MYKVVSGENTEGGLCRRTNLALNHFPRISRVERQRVEIFHGFQIFDGCSVLPVNF